MINRVRSRYVHWIVLICELHLVSSKYGHLVSCCGHHTQTCTWYHNLAHLNIKAAKIQAQSNILCACARKAQQIGMQYACLRGWETYARSEPDLHSWQDCAKEFEQHIHQRWNAQTSNWHWPECSVDVVSLCFCLCVSSTLQQLNMTSMIIPSKHHDPYTHIHTHSLVQPCTAHHQPHIYTLRYVSMHLFEFVSGLGVARVGWPDNIWVV